MRTHYAAILLPALCLAGCGAERHPLKIAGIFSENVVLQRDMPVKLWGWAHPGTRVNVVLGRTRAQAEVDAQGRWAVSMPPMPAGGPHQLVVRDDRRSIVVDNILIGEVWLAAGQSNMNWPLRWVNGGSREIRRASEFPNVRLADAKATASLEPRQDVAVKWQAAAPKVVAGYAGVPYLFATRLNRELDVPVGILRVAFGATGILPFVAPAKLAQLRDRHAEQAIPHPNPDSAKGRHQQPGTIYNGMLHPLRGFGMRGMIWYQGEAETYNDDGLLYADKQTAMVAGLREAWGRGDWPFYYVHLPPFDYASLKKWFPKATGTSLLKKWEAQAKCLRTIPNSDMVVITDLGNPKDIHPKDKIPVATRLANLALKRTYGRAGIVAHGPVFKSMALRGAKAVVHFAHAEGLTTRDGKPLTWFEVAGSDKTFRAARATIAGDTVVVWSPKVAAPVAVRYNWHDTAVGNICNRAGLPARPFRTDSW